MPDVIELFAGITFLGAIFVSFVAGVVGYAFVVRVARKRGLRISWLLYPLVVAIAGLVYWYVVRVPLGSRTPVFGTGSLLRSVMGFLVLTTPPCLVWLSPAMAALLWMKLAERVKRPSGT